MPGWRSGGMLGGTVGGSPIGGLGAFSGCGGVGRRGMTVQLEMISDPAATTRFTEPFQR
jgi:hypothetical protein